MDDSRGERRVSAPLTLRSCYYLPTKLTVSASIRQLCQHDDLERGDFPELLLWFVVSETVVPQFPIFYGYFLLRNLG